MRTRSRSSVVANTMIPVGTNVSYKWVNGIGWVHMSTVPYYYSVPASYKCTSFEHCTDELHPGPPYKSGGPLDVLKVERSLRVGRGSILEYTVFPLKYIYKGGFMCTYPAPIPVSAALNVTNAKSSLGDVSSLGAGAYQQFSPVKPRVELGQFIAEFAEIPRMLASTAKTFHKTWKSMGGRSRSLAPKDVANEWLNTQFGWVPFLSTIRDFYGTTVKLDNHLKRLKKYNGKWQRREGRVRQTLASETLYNGSGYIFFTMSSAFGAKPHCIAVQETHQDVWFTGKYRYYIPELEKSAWPKAVIARLYGLDISPSLLWELTPWSWLIDWYANVGSVLKNWNDNQDYDLVTKYAYIMGTTRKVNRVSCHISTNGGSLSDEWEFFGTRKQRVGATPYGFGVQFNDLSTWQISILSALGLSKDKLKWQSGGLF